MTSMYPILSLSSAVAVRAIGLATVGALALVAARSSDAGQVAWLAAWAEFAAVLTPFAAALAALDALADAECAGELQALASLGVERWAAPLGAIAPAATIAALPALLGAGYPLRDATAAALLVVVAWGVATPAARVFAQGRRTRPLALVVGVVVAIPIYTAASLSA